MSLSVISAIFCNNDWRCGISWWTKISQLYTSLETNESYTSYCPLLINKIRRWSWHFCIHQVATARGLELQLAYFGNRHLLTNKQHFKINNLIHPRGILVTSEMTAPAWTHASTPAKSVCHWKGAAVSSACVQFIVTAGLETPVNPRGMEAVHSGHSVALSLSTPVIELDTDYPWVSGRIWSRALSGVGEHTRRAKWRAAWLTCTPHCHLSPRAGERVCIQLGQSASIVRWLHQLFLNILLLRISWRGKNR